MTEEDNKDSQKGFLFENKRKLGKKGSIQSYKAR
jgi:hypothetical protein